MFRLLLTGLLLSCGSDISVITVEKNGEETGAISEPEVLDTQTNEPRSAARSALDLNR